MRRHLMVCCKQKFGEKKRIRFQSQKNFYEHKMDADRILIDMSSSCTDILKYGDRSGRLMMMMASMTSKQKRKTAERKVKRS